MAHGFNAEWNLVYGHRVDIEHLGAGIWRPYCGCTWTGTPTNDRPTAWAEANDHIHNPDDEDPT